MKLTAALSKLKSYKSQLKRVDGYIEKSLVFYEGDQPEHVYTEETENRRKLVQDIRVLKGRIMATNVTTKVPLEDGKTSTLTELILFNAELRSELAHWTKLLGTTAEVDSHFHGRTKDTVKKVFAEGFNKKEIKARINQLEASKAKIDDLIQQANMETELL